VIDVQFLCPNCSIISDISKIEIDNIKRNRSRDIQREIDDLESEIKKEESKFIVREGYIGCLRMDVLNKTILKRECDTEYEYIECPICRKRHYIDSSSEHNI